MSVSGIVVVDAVSDVRSQRLPNADRGTAADQTTLTPTSADRLTADRADRVSKEVYRCPS
jgi:hypothetical protein